MGDVTRILSQIEDGDPKAAEELHLTQPAVSIQIKRLEAKLGMPLIEHIGKELHLTVAGEEVPFMSLEERAEILKKFHPDAKDEGRRELKVGVSKGYAIAHEFADLLEATSRVDPALLDIIVFGRTAGTTAAEYVKTAAKDGALNLDHVVAYNKEVEASGAADGRVAPAIIPDYTEPEVRERQLTAKELSASLSLSRR